MLKQYKNMLIQQMILHIDYANNYLNEAYRICTMCAIEMILNATPESGVLDTFVATERAEF